MRKRIIGHAGRVILLLLSAGTLSPRKPTMSRASRPGYMSEPSFKARSSVKAARDETAVNGQGGQLGKGHSCSEGRLCLVPASFQDPAARETGPDQGRGSRHQAERAAESIDVYERGRGPRACPGRPPKAEHRGKDRLSRTRKNGVLLGQRRRSGAVHGGEEIMKLYTVARPGCSVRPAAAPGGPCRGGEQLAAARHSGIGGHGQGGYRRGGQVRP